MTTQDPITQAALALWDFHCVYDALEPADAIVGLGSYDLRVADRCAELFHQGLADTLLFTGASGNWTRGLYAGSEARAFFERALALGVPEAAMVLEEAATNIGENLRFSSRLLPEARRVILVTKPQTQLRCAATAARQVPEIAAMTTAPLTPFADQPTAAHGERELICEMVGDLKRMETYPALGYQAEVEISEEVRAAGDVLIAAGFTDHLPR